MNCREFWSNWPPIQTGGAPPAGLSPECKQHLAVCPGCAASFERQVSLTAGLRALAAEFSHLCAPARVEARLLAQFRTRTAAAPPPARAVHRTPFFGWAAAAVLLLAAGVLLTGGRQPLSPQHPLPAAAQLASADPDEPETAESDFVPLPYAGQLPADEDMDLVRVEVPRSAMIAAGFAVSADRAAEPVEADVLLGPDGLARAVRFVN